MRQTVINRHNEYMIRDTVAHCVHDGSSQQSDMVRALEGRPPGNLNARP